MSQISSFYKYAKISPYKLRLVADVIRKKKVLESLDYLNFSNKKASLLIKKTLKSAIANAENNFGLDAAQLKVEKILIDKGSVAKRFRARARGRGAKILKSTSHITIVLGK